MAGRVLTANVALRNPETGQPEVFEEGSVAPSWAADQVDDHVFAATARAADGEVPPKGGAGSGKDAWAAYAASRGVEVDEDATRDDIVAALESAGVPTE